MSSWWRKLCIGSFGKVPEPKSYEQVSQADPSMVKVQVRSHYQCVGGGVCVAGKTKRSGDWDREGHV
jgi:hypothetical protein